MRCRYVLRWYTGAGCCLCVAAVPVRRGSEQRAPGSRLSSVGAGTASESSGTSASTELSAGSVQLDQVPHDVAAIIDRVRRDPRVGFFYLVASVPTHAVERHYYCLR